MLINYLASNASHCADYIVVKIWCEYVNKTKQGRVRTDLKDDDECQPGSQDMPELQGEVIGHGAPGRCSVVPVPA